MPDVRLIDANALCKGINESIKMTLEWESEAQEQKDTIGVKYAIDTRRSLLSMLERVLKEPTIDAQPVKSMNDKAHWTDTDETVWDAKNKDSGQEFEIAIVAAKCSACERWAEQVNTFPPYMHYEYCPHCGRKMEIKR